MFYKIMNKDGYVLLNQYEKAGEMVLGYGGVWGKDHRKAKRFKTYKDCQKEINKMPYGKGTKFLVVSSQEDYKKVFNKRRNEL